MDCVEWKSYSDTNYELQFTIGNFIIPLGVGSLNYNY